MQLGFALKFVSTFNCLGLWGVGHREFMKGHLCCQNCFLPVSFINRRSFWTYYMNSLYPMSFQSHLSIFGDNFYFIIIFPWNLRYFLMFLTIFFLKLVLCFLLFSVIFYIMWYNFESQKFSLEKKQFIYLIFLLQFYFLLLEPESKPMLHLFLILFQVR